MMWLRLSLGGLDRTYRENRPERRRDGPSRNSRQRLCVESLEGRRLLAAVTDFPLSSNLRPSAALTAGPDGNLWFPVQEGQGQILRITPSGVLANYPLPPGYSSPSALTVGPDGNLWFIDRT